MATKNEGKIEKITKGEIIFMESAGTLTNGTIASFLLLEIMGNMPPEQQSKAVVTLPVLIFTGFAVAFTVTRVIVRLSFGKDFPGSGQRRRQESTAPKP